MSIGTGPRRVLFVCTANIDRSPTAERLYRNTPGIEVRSAGISRSARTPLDSGQLEWADLVVVMEPAHEQAIRERHPESAAEIVSIDVPDLYLFMSDELVAILTSRLAPILGAPGTGSQ